MRKLKSLEGFTLVELLIVIAIIGAMSVFFINSSAKSLLKARDGRRQNDLEKIRTGIETYYADCNAYPPSLPAPGSKLTGSCPTANTYINSIPDDPQSSQGKHYSYTLTGTTYTICAALEGTVTAVAGCGSCGSATCSYQITNP